MGELQHVTEGSTLLVTIADIKKSEFAPLLERIYGGEDSETQDGVVGGFISDEMDDLFDYINKDFDAFNDDEKLKTVAKKTVVNMVGLRLLLAAQMARIRFDEAEYTRTWDRVEKKIEKEKKNLMDARSPVTVTNVETNLYDPDSDYPDGG